MSKYIGRLVKLGIAKEAVRGTKETTMSFWLPILSADHQNKVGYVFNESALGTIADSTGGDVSSKKGEGGFSALLGDRHFGLILKALLGSLSSAQKGGETLVYEHTASLLESAQHQSLTIGFDEPNGDASFAGGVLTSLEIKFETEKLLTYTAKFISKLGESVTHTASFTAENIFRANDVKFYIASTLAGLSSPTEIKVRSFTLKFEKGITEDMVLGSVEPADFLTTEFKVSGSLEAIFDDTTYSALNLAGTTKALRVKAIKDDTTIGSASKPTLQIDLAKVVFNEYAKNISLSDVVMQSVSFKGVYSQGDSKIVEAILTNLVATY